MNNNKKFLKFYLNTNTISGWIRNQEELDEAMDQLISAKVSIFGICAKNSFDRFEFGNKFDHTGRTSLFEFLDANGVDISNYLQSRMIG